MKQKGFKYKVRKRIIQKATHNNSRCVVFPTINTLRTIAVVKYIDDKSDFERYLAKFSNNLKLVVFNISNNKGEKNLVNNQLSLAELNFWKLPSNKQIDAFVAEPFDLLINFLDFESDAIDYIFAKSEAKFKACTSLAGCCSDLLIEQKKFDGSLFLNELHKTFSNFNIQR